MDSFMTLCLATSSGWPLQAAMLRLGSSKGRRMAPIHSLVSLNRTPAVNLQNGSKMAPTGLAQWAFRGESGESDL